MECYGYKMSLKRALRPAKPKPSLSTRALRLIWRNPRMVHTMLREEYRKRFGIALDRRFRDGLSGPPVSINLHLTRRCNLSCVMCEQHRHTPGPTGLSWYDPRRELPLSSWVDLLDQVAAFRPRLYLTGGEPTLYPHFAALPDRSQAAGLRGAPPDQRHLAGPHGRHPGGGRGGDGNGLSGRA